LPSGPLLNDLRLITGKYGHSIAMPAVKQLDRDGKRRVDAKGKPIFNQLIEFRDRATADRFSAMGLALVRTADPTFQGEEK
jgi:hypothetical protein